MQLAFTERVVPAMQAFDRSLGLVYVADTDKSLTSRRFYKTHAVIQGTSCANTQTIFGILRMNHVSQHTGSYF